MKDLEDPKTVVLKAVVEYEPLIKKFGFHLEGERLDNGQPFQAYILGFFSYEIFLTIYYPGVEPFDHYELVLSISGQPSKEFIELKNSLDRDLGLKSRFQDSVFTNNHQEIVYILTRDLRDTRKLGIFLQVLKSFSQGN